MDCVPLLMKQPWETEPALFQNKQTEQDFDVFLD